MDLTNSEEPLTPTTYKKRYSSSWFYGQTDTSFPTIEEQVELCRKIASQLVNDENRESKGATMFYRRVKRAPKWVHQSKVTTTTTTSGKHFTDDRSEPMSEDEREQIEKMRLRFRDDNRKPLKLILDPRELKSVERLKKIGTSFSEHNVVSPDVCHNLVKDLNSPEVNKGAQIFLKRKEKSSQWIVEENPITREIRELKEKQEKIVREESERPTSRSSHHSALSGTSGFSSNRSNVLIESKPRIKLVKSPWEAALTTGNVDNAFVTLSDSPLAQSIKDAAVKKNFILSTDSDQQQSTGSDSINRKYDKNLYLARAPRGWMSNEPRCDEGIRSASAGSFYQQNFYQPGHSCSPLTIGQLESSRNSSRAGNYPEQSAGILGHPATANQSTITSQYNPPNDIPHFNLLSFASNQQNLPKFRDFNSSPRGFTRC